MPANANVPCLAVETIFKEAKVPLIVSFLVGWKINGVFLPVETLSSKAIGWFALLLPPVQLTVINAQPVSQPFALQIT